MTGPVRLEIVTPEKIVVSEDAQIVMAPGVLGEFGVLTGHTPFLTALKAGAVLVDGMNPVIPLELPRHRVRRWADSNSIPRNGSADE